MCNKTIKVIYGYCYDNPIINIYKEICKRGWFEEVNSEIRKPIPTDFKYIDCQEGDVVYDDQFELLFYWVHDFLNYHNTTQAIKYIHMDFPYYDDSDMFDRFILGVEVGKFNTDGKIGNFTKPDTFPFNDISEEDLDFYCVGGVCNACNCDG